MAICLGGRRGRGRERWQNSRPNDVRAVRSMLAQDVQLALGLLLFVRATLSVITHHGVVRLGRLGEERPKTDTALTQRTMQKGRVGAEETAWDGVQR